MSHNLPDTAHDPGHVLCCNRPPVQPHALYAPHMQTSMQTPLAPRARPQAFAFPGARFGGWRGCLAGQRWPRKLHEVEQVLPDHCNSSGFKVQGLGFRIRIPYLPKCLLRAGTFWVYSSCFVCCFL